MLRFVNISKIFAFAAVAIVAAGCSDYPENPTYTISKKGEYFTDRQYDVIHVYGFGDNRMVAEDIVEFLNREEPRTYSLRRDE
jgi:hypothetical protein